MMLSFKVSKESYRKIKDMCNKKGMKPHEVIDMFVLTPNKRSVKKEPVAEEV